MSDEHTESERLTRMMYREAATAFTSVMAEFLRQQKDVSDSEESDVATMIQIWTETGDFFIQRVRAEFPDIRDQQDVELLIEETREPPEEEP